MDVPEHRQGPGIQSFLRDRRSVVESPQGALVSPQMKLVLRLWSFTHSTVSQNIRILTCLSAFNFAKN